MSLRFVYLAVAAAGSLAANVAQAAECGLDAATQWKAANAFNKMLPVLRHPRCANCHGALNVFDVNTDHPGGAMVDLKENVFGETEVIHLGSSSCTMCHDLGDKKWIQENDPASEIQWAGLSDADLWRRFQNTRVIVGGDPDNAQDATGRLLLEHTRHDHLIALGFDGTRGMSANGYMGSFGMNPPDPPPLSKAEFIAALDEWIGALGAYDAWPKEDCAVALANHPEGSPSPIKVAEKKISGTWSGTWKRNDRPASGGFTLTVETDENGAPSATFMGRKAKNVTRSSNKVTMKIEPASECTGANLEFDFVDGAPVKGKYSAYGKPESCSRTGSYSFP